MSKSLRKLLNSNRVRKRSQPAPAANSPRKSSIGNQNQRQSATSLLNTTRNTSASQESEDLGRSTLFDDSAPLPDEGHASMLSIFSDVSLCDVPQAVNWSLAHMWSPLPTPHGSTLSATSARAQSFRKGIPPVVSMGHVAAVLSTTTPTALEREVVELRGAGAIRKVEIRRREGGREGVMLSSELEHTVKECVHDAETAETWVRWLRQNPFAMTVTAGAKSGTGGTVLTSAQASELVRVGLLTADSSGGTLVDDHLFSRGDGGSDGSLLSLAAVGRSLTLAEAGVPGVAPKTGHAVQEAEVLRVAVPGYGTLVKMSELAVERLVELLRKTRHREAPASVLKEWWDGGALEVGEIRRRHGARLGNSTLGTPSHRTKKWKEFHGLAFEWVLLEAVGVGVVEVFETGSVGRAVRHVGS